MSLWTETEFGSWQLREGDYDIAEIRRGMEGGYWVVAAVPMPTPHEMLELHSPSFEEGPDGLSAAKAWGERALRRLWAMAAAGMGGSRRP